MRPGLLGSTLVPGRARLPKTRIKGCRVMSSQSPSRAGRSVCPLQWINGAALLCFVHHTVPPAENPELSLAAAHCALTGERRQPRIPDPSES